MKRTRIKLRHAAALTPFKREGAMAYIGPLSKSQIDSGIAVCLNYGKRLRQIVMAIADKQRGLGLALACIRVEELAKIHLLLEMRTGSHDAESWKHFWKSFRDHEKKWSAYGESSLKSLEMDDASAKEFGKGFSHWSKVKNSGFYVEFFDGVGFAPPGILPGGFLETALEMGDKLDKRFRGMP